MNARKSLRGVVHSMWYAVVIRCWGCHWFKCQLHWHSLQRLWNSWPALRP